MKLAKVEMTNKNFRRTKSFLAKLEEKLINASRKDDHAVKIRPWYADPTSRRWGPVRSSIAHNLQSQKSRISSVSNLFQTPSKFDIPRSYRILRLITRLTTEHYRKYVLVKYDGGRPIFPGVIKQVSCMHSAGDNYFTQFSQLGPSIHILRSIFISCQLVYRTFALFKLMFRLSCCVNAVW